MDTAILGQITHQHIINGVQQREPDQEEYNGLQGMNGWHILLGVKHQCEGPENIERGSAKDIVTDCAFIEGGADIHYLGKKLGLS